MTRNGVEFQIHLLSDPSVGLYIPPMTWVSIYDFAPGSICHVVASNHYDETDHIRDYNEFLRVVLEMSQNEAES